MTPLYPLASVPPWCGAGDDYHREAGGCWPLDWCLAHGRDVRPDCEGCEHKREGEPEPEGEPCEHNLEVANDGDGDDHNIGQRRRDVCDAA